MNTTIEKATLSLHHAASTDKTRENLNRVNVELDKAWATDGKILAIIPLDGEPDPTGAHQTKIPAETAKRALAVKGFSAESPVILQRRARIDGNGRVRVIVGETALDVESPDGPSPNMAMVTRDLAKEGDENTVTIGLDVALLMRLARAFGSKPSFAPLKLTIPLDGLSPIAVEAGAATTSHCYDATKNTANPNAHGVVMPMRVS